MLNNSFTNDFNAALVQFFANMETLPPDAIHPDITTYSGDICRLLRIARFDVIFKELVLGKRQPQTIVHDHCFFHESTPNMERSLKITKFTNGGSTVEYTLYPHIGSDNWTEEESEYINKFISAMFVFNGRARTMQICEKLTFTDAELDVYNLSYFIKNLNELIERKMTAGKTACRFNLKKFTIINRRIGRNQGTMVMREYIAGLNKLIAPVGFVSRLGGDNFVAIFNSEKAEDVRNYLMGRMIQTGIDGVGLVTVSARSAYYVIPEGNITSTDIMDKLSTTFSLLKHDLSLTEIEYNDEVSKMAEDQRLVEDFFSEALNNEEFSVYYQPKVNLKNYSLSGAEALCRWRHNGELISPTRFIPVLERNGNICLLDFYMLEHVCRHMRRWLDNGMPAIKVSVNFSRIHLGRENLARKIIDIIKKYDIPNEFIEIELTETTTDVDFAELKQVVTALHRVGISTSIDDFGIGYSSLNLIRELPWNVLKIDKSFLPAEGENNDSQKKIMLKYVIAMAQSLGLECIVEGVETVEHVSLLKENNCYRAQGFFFDEPLPVDEFEQRIITKQNTI